eukprot:1061811-Pyramimonas_sp.AAC.1
MKRLAFLRIGFVSLHLVHVMSPLSVALDGVTIGLAACIMHACTFGKYSRSEAMPLGSLPLLCRTYFSYPSCKGGVIPFPLSLSHTWYPWSSERWTI